MAERHLDGERGDVPLGEIAGAGPGVHPERGELAHPLGDADRVQVAGDDLGARLAERQRDGVADLPGASHAGHQGDLAAEVESSGVMGPRVVGHGARRREVGASRSRRSSHSMGTSCEPSAPWLSPGSGSPCQSLPPVRSSPSRREMSVRRERTSGSWLGWRVSIASRPSLLQPLDEGAGAPILEVRHRDEPAHRVDQLRDLAERGQHLLDERRAPAADVAVERLRHAERPATADDGPGHVRPAHRAASRLAQHVVEVERHAHALQPVHHGARAPHPIGPAALEKRLQGGGVGREEIPEHVHLAPRRGGGELAAGDDTHAEPLAGRDRRGNARDRVVIGEGDRAEPRRRRPLDHRLRRQAPVRRGRVDVEIDDRAGRRCLTGPGQRR